MFDYWKKRLLVQVRQLDDSLAQEMQVASSLEEWKLRGIKVCVILKTFIIFVCMCVCEDISWSNFKYILLLHTTDINFVVIVISLFLAP